MKSSLVWNAPLVVVLLGIIAWVGGLWTATLAAVSIETLAVVAYLVVRGRRGYPYGAPISNLLLLLPGHLLVLMSLVLVQAPDRLAFLWMVIPAASVAYDLVTATSRNTRLGRSILAGVYGILWADVFYLLLRVISLGREFSAGEETIAAIAFGVGGTVFIALGIYRHWRAS